jgi:hypothetical protein
MCELWLDWAAWYAGLLCKDRKMQQLMSRNLAEGTQVLDEKKKAIMPPSLSQIPHDQTRDVTGLRSGEPTANHLSYGMTIKILNYVISLHYSWRWVRENMWAENMEYTLDITLGDVNVMSTASAN